MKFFNFIFTVLASFFFSYSSIADELQQGISKPITLDFVMGKFNPAKHPDFVKINSKYANRKGMYMQKQAYDAFKQMHKDAKKAGIDLQIRSAARNFKYQKGIWERKWTGATKVGGQNLAKKIKPPEKRASRILRYSSMPGSSRHHWGTDIDLNSFENSWFESGKGLKLYNWMQENAAKYGFCQVYTAKGEHRSTGYEEEKWHWSYVPLAKKYTHFAGHHLESSQFAGFKGAQAAEIVGIVENYVLGVDPKCQH